MIERHAAEELVEAALRFWPRVAMSDGCWLWTGSTTAQGYGRMQALGEWYAHRVSWILAHNGARPGSLFVLHRCDTPGCVRPSHLFLGTQAENMADARAKGRHAHGSRQAATRLIDDDVRVIRLLSGQGFRTDDLAEFWQMHPSSIRRIVRRDDWRHVA